MDTLGDRAEWETGYAPTMVLIESGKVKDKYAGSDFGKANAFVES